MKPKLRFPGYEEEWEEKKFQELTCYSSNGFVGTVTDYYVDKDDKTAERYIVGANVRPNKVDLTSQESYINKEFRDKYPKAKVQLNDMLMVQSGHIGTCCVVDEKIAGLYCHAIIINRFNDFVNPYFISQFMNSDVGYKKLSLLFTGTTIKHINVKDLRKLRLNLPSLPEQKKIGEFFSLLDQRIEKQEEKIELMKERKKGWMQKVFHQEIRFKDENGNDYPDWEEKKLGDIATIIGGGTPATNVEEYWDGDIQWFTPSEIKNKYIDTSSRKITTLGLQKSSAKLLPKHSILLTTRATLGEMSILKKEASTNQGFQSIIVNENNNYEFIYYLQPLIKQQCYKKAAGSTFLEISKREIERIVLKIPSLPEQEKIANFLSAQDELIEKEEEKLNLLKEQKKGLLQQMFI